MTLGKDLSDEQPYRLFYFEEISRFSDLSVVERWSVAPSVSLWTFLSMTVFTVENNSWLKDSSGHDPRNPGSGINLKSLVTVFHFSLFNGTLYVYYYSYHY